MELKINKKTNILPAVTLTVQALLDLEILEKQKGIAIAITTTVIPKSNWNSIPKRNRYCFNYFRNPRRLIGCSGCLFVA
jgi:sulfur carrier protein